MKNVVTINAAEISDWTTFHSVYSDKFGFPDFYGMNMDAWIDCMTSLDSPEDGMTNVHAPKGGVITIQIDNYADLKQRCPEQWLALIECSAFVNFRRIEVGEAPVLALSFHN